MLNALEYEDISHVHRVKCCYPFTYLHRTPVSANESRFTLNEICLHHHMLHLGQFQANILFHKHKDNSIITAESY